MIRGIGIDTVVIGDVEGLLKRMSKGTLSKVFTQGELSAAQEKAGPAEYLASRFAVKEAAFQGWLTRDLTTAESRRETMRTEAHISMLTAFSKRYWTVPRSHRFSFPSQQPAAWPLLLLLQNREFMT